MTNSTKILALACALAASAGITSGCATTGELASLQEEVKRSTEAANRAAANADAARKEATEAARLAEEAKSASEHANRIALDAQATSQATDARIDRMFKRAMYK